MFVQIDGLGSYLPQCPLRYSNLNLKQITYGGLYGGGLSSILGGRKGGEVKWGKVRTWE